jgi:hypothetical protein
MRRAVIFAVLIDQVDWLPNSQTLAFSTNIVNLEGPGAAPQADLWLVTTSGSLTEQFAVGHGRPHLCALAGRQPRHFLATRRA